MPVTRCYLDYNSTSPLCRAARQAIIDNLDLYGNPSSIHTEGRVAKNALEKARSQVAGLIHASPDNVIFTSGASEAALMLLSPSYQLGRSPVRVSKLYFGATEHPCVASGGQFKAEDRIVVPVAPNGIINCSKLQQLLDGHDRSFGVPLVAIQAANNESGVIQPLKQIAAIVKDAGGMLVVDAVQFVGKNLLDIEELGGDFFFLSAHKIGGPKGVGALIANGNIMRPQPIQIAGGQEKGFRGGTQALSSIIAFGAAAEEARTNFEVYSSHCAHLRHHLEQGLRQLANNIIIIGEGAPRLPNTTFFTIPGIKAETLQIAYDLAGFAISAGSACSSGKIGQSHVLHAMGIEGDGAIRVSTGKSTSIKEIGLFLAATQEILSRKNTNR